MTATATPKRSRKQAAEPAADSAHQTAPPAAPDTPPATEATRPAPRRTDHTSTVIPRRPRWWTATPPRPRPGEPNVTPQTVHKGFSRSFCVYCDAKGQDHAEGERECILRKRALRAECNILDLRKANAMFRRWLAWAARVSTSAK